MYRNFYIKTSSPQEIREGKLKKNEKGREGSSVTTQLHGVWVNEVILMINSFLHFYKICLSQIKRNKEEDANDVGSFMKQMCLLRV